MKNEIHRILNHVAAKDVRTVVVESLDFRGGGLSKRMNRILSRAGRKAWREKLKDLEERHGISTVEVNPAYTSQQCSACGYTAKQNRASRDRFLCQHCGHAGHADVNAARNILRRSQDGSCGYRYVRKETVLTDLDTRFRAQHGYGFDAVSPRQPAAA